MWSSWRTDFIDRTPLRDCTKIERAQTPGRARPRMFVRVVYQKMRSLGKTNLPTHVKFAEQSRVLYLRRYSILHVCQPDCYNSVSISLD